jgi:hypothetical protein
VASSFDYRLFGLRIRSGIELPELAAVEPHDDVDVVIELAEVSAPADPSVEYSVGELGACLAIPGVARYLISGGSRIDVNPDAGAPMRNVRLYLLGSAMGILLHQRGLLPLHANAIEIDGSAIAFMGASGAGKSTLAAWFLDHGYRVLADDVCVVHVGDRGKLMVGPGLSRLRLWEDAMAASGRKEAQFQRSYAGDEDYRKYDVPVPREADANSVPLAAVFLLHRAEQLAITALHGIDAVEAIFANTYRGAFIREAGISGIHLDSCVRLVRETPIFRFERPWGHELINEQIGQLLAQVRSSIVPLQE